MSFVKPRKPLSEQTVEAGREFLICLVKQEFEIRRAVIQVENAKIANWLHNWCLVTALVIRKLSAVTLGESDLDIDLEEPTFVLCQKNIESLKGRNI